MARIITSDDGNAKIIYNYVEYGAHASFISNDVLEIMGEDTSLFEIILLKAEVKSKGYGTKLLTEFLTDITSNHPQCPIVLQAEPMYVTVEEHNTALSDGSFDTTLDRIVSFYKKNGFESINHLVEYSNAVAMLYVGNDVGKNLYDTINKLISEERNQC